MKDRSMTDDTVSTIGAQIKQAAQKLERQRQLLQQLEAARPPLAWAVQSGHPDARSSLAENTEQQELARSEIRDLELALDEAHKRLRSAERAVLEAEADRRLQEAQKIGKQILAHAESFTAHVAAADSEWILASISRELFTTAARP